MLLVGGHELGEELRLHRTGDESKARLEQRGLGGRQFVVAAGGVWAGRGGAEGEPDAPQRVRADVVLALRRLLLQLGRPVPKRGLRALVVGEWGQGREKGGKHRELVVLGLAQAVRRSPGGRPHHRRRRDPPEPVHYMQTAGVSRVRA